jgi:rhamnulokinase
MENKSFLAIDLGATSGRVICGTIENGRLTMDDLHKFPNGIIGVHGSFYWNFFELYRHIKEGLTIAARKGIKPVSIGVDTWGVDIAFVGEDGSFMGLPYAYRNYTTKDNTEQFLSEFPLKEIYARTGIQTLDFNTVFQLYALKKRNSSQLKAAKDILFMPDAISYLLTGKKVTEYTIASTSEMLDPNTKEFDPKILEFLGIDRAKFPGQVIMPGQIIGTLTKELAEETGLGEVPVVAVAGHDTGSAVVAVPAANKHFAYLSSGTWSLMGLELPEPVIDERSQAANITNEGGVDGTIRFLKNITGMWILEQCKKEWDVEKAYSYDELIAMALEAKPFEFLFDPDNEAFANPSSMTKAIVDVCKANGQGTPETVGQFVRAIFDSLALRYKQVFEALQSFASFPIETLHVIGGGSRNSFLNQLTANALGVKVVAGPSEATAIGNMMLQAKASGLFSDLQEIRDFICASIDLTEFMPEETGVWDDAYSRFLTYTKLL